MAYELALRRQAERLSGPTASSSVLAGSAAPASDGVHHGQPKVTIVHKSNVLSTTDGLFRDTIKALPTLPEFGDKYTSVTVAHQIVAPTSRIEQIRAELARARAFAGLFTRLLPLEQRRRLEALAAGVDAALAIAEATGTSAAVDQADDRLQDYRFAAGA